MALSLTLTEAITKVEAAVTDLGSADANQAQAQAKFDAAKAAKEAADAADVTATTSYNAAIDDLIAAATAAKRPVAAAPPTV